MLFQPAYAGDAGGEIAQTETLVEMTLFTGTGWIEEYRFTVKLLKLNVFNAANEVLQKAEEWMIFMMKENSKFRKSCNGNRVMENLSTENRAMENRSTENRTMEL